LPVRSWIVAFVLACSPASAVWSQQADVWEEVSNYRGWPVTKLVVVGVDKDIGKDLREGLQLSTEKTKLYEKRLREDIDRVRLYLARRGYPYSRVYPGIQTNEKKRTLELELDVKTGPPVVIRNYRLAGVPESYREVIEASLRNRPGDVFVDEHLRSDVASVVQGLKTEGHARANADAAIDWFDSTHVDVRITAVPGPVYYFREVTAEGVSEDLVGLAYTLADISRGERYEPRVMKDASDYLGRTGLFRQIRLNMEDSAPDSLDVRIELQERKPITVEVGGGYWSDEKFTGRIRWQHRNIFRRGRGTSLEAVYNAYRKWGEWSAWWPALFGMRKSLATVRAGIKNEKEDSYEMTAPGVGISYGYRFTGRFSATIDYTLERARYTIKTTESGFFQDPIGVVGYFGATLSRDGTDDRINPTRGTFSWLRLQWGPPGGVSQSNWVLAEANATWMWRLKSTVFATNVHGGWGKPLAPATTLLPDKRFYAGGSTSHRGFNRRRLGPKDENGAPLGGEVLATGFFEYRFPIAWKLNGAVFLDWGQVWRTRNDMGQGNIEIAVGPALRVITPVGPLRLDWGIRLTDYDKTQSWWALHFAIGYPM
jgi:outer membrane protein insertion porin family